MAKVVRYRIKRFDKISPKFPVKVRELSAEWAVATVEQIKLRLSSGQPPKIETGNLRNSVRFDLKGGIKAVQRNKERTKVDTLFVRFKAGSGETIRTGRDENFLVPYATQRERGGFIVPRKAQRLFIPINRSDRGMGKIWKGDPQYKRVGSKIFRINPDGPDTLVAVLKLFLFQRGTPYMLPVVEKELPKLKKAIKNIQAKDVEVKDTRL